MHLPSHTFFFLEMCRREKYVGRHVSYGMAHAHCSHEQGQPVGPGVSVFPEILYGGEWHPICGHKAFARNTTEYGPEGGGYGVSIFCQMLGYESGEAFFFI